MRLIIGILVGALAGWIAGQIMNLKLNFWKCAGLGIIGGFVGSIIGALLGLSGKGLMGIILDVVGACIVILIVRKVKSK